MNTFVRIAPAMLAVVLLSTASAATRQDDDAIARAIVIGQVYPSGDVIFGGFIDDDTRSWPPRVTVTPMFAKGERNPGVDFVRAWTLENPFAPPEIAANSSPGPEEDIFAGIDRFFDDRLVALYLARSPLKVSTAVIGWSDALDVTEVSFREQGKPRPATAGDLAQVARRKQSLPKDIECTTEPQGIDAAKLILTARVSSSTTLRLSRYEDPGCLGHLTVNYVLDVVTRGREARRYQFRHYAGVL